MNIVANTYFLRNLRNLDFFTLDMGKSKRVIDSNEFRKLDEFSIKYRELYNNRVNKFGNIANKIFFYEDLSMDKNDLVIFKNDIYELKYTQADIDDLENYILGLLRKVDDIENEDNNSESESKLSKQDIEETGWKCDDMKNGKKVYLIDQTLTKDEYRKQLLKKIS